MASGKNSIRKQKKRRAEGSKTGTTWINRDNKIIQADEGRNKGRLFKEKAGQDVSKVRSRQKSRSDARKLPGAVGESLKRSFLSIKGALTPKQKTKRRKKY